MLLFPAKPPGILNIYSTFKSLPGSAAGRHPHSVTLQMDLFVPSCPSAADLHLHHFPSDRLGGQLLFAEAIASLSYSVAVAMSVLVTSLTNLLPRCMKMTHSWQVYTCVTSLHFL